MCAKSYREQYDRVCRALTLLEEIYNGIEQDRNSEYYKDRVYSFFQNCFHLRDWIVYDPLCFPGKTEDAKRQYMSDNLINCEMCMKVCADVCNGSKHSKIDRPKADPNTILKSTNWKLKLGGETTIISVDGFNIECDNQTYDALELAKECIEKWDIFITQNKLLT